MRALVFVLRRLLAAAGTLLAVSVVLFAGSEVLPGDAASASLGINATAEQTALVRAELGLDRPLAVRYLEWIGNAVQGDLGVSVLERAPVAEIVAIPLADTALLTLLAALATIVIATALGLAAGLRPGSRIDRLLSGGALVAVSIPQFVIAGLLVLLFSSVLGWLPAVSLVPAGGAPIDRPEILILPVASLTIFAAAWASRLIRAIVIDANTAPNVEAARLAGLPERQVIRRHLIPATIGPAAQAYAWLASALFGGTAVIEQIFNYPGLSETLVNAVRHHDTPVLEGVGLLLAGIIIGSLVIADLIGLLVNPKLRTAA
ncbi:ABC transporter permease [Actinokineospora iranica]|uniref:Peptide/nickel transport system permease protein n=1 Tax=Actinokineospora iranica TaxID=1271860 RepID=A0A1G6W8Z6_9PSEU|nr:ABC transporter permease [Actinokineospora iranica]SDD62291.1 peptide/nickel transport system permease protein [Actinokineospora iranica]